MLGTHDAPGGAPGYGSRASRRISRRAAAGGFLTLIGLAACVRQPDGPAPIPAEDLIAHPGRDEWPAFVRQAGASIHEAYRYAATNPATLTVIPCYCGCVSFGHRSSYDCFVHEARPDGSVHLDTHALGCAVCIDTALDVARLEAEGMPLTAIRETIDHTYSRSGPGTNTPRPPASGTSAP